MSVVTWREQAVDQERAGLCLTADTKSAPGTLTRCV